MPDERPHFFYFLFFIFFRVLSPTARETDACLWIPEGPGERDHRWEGGERGGGDVLHNSASRELIIGVPFGPTLFFFSSFSFVTKWLE